MVFHSFWFGFALLSGNNQGRIKPKLTGDPASQNQQAIKKLRPIQIFPTHQSCSVSADPLILILYA